METLQSFINTANDVLWTYILIAMLLGCAVYFTWRTRFVQFRNLREMLRLLTEGAPKSRDGKRQVSSFQAFAVSIASRVGTGNLAGVATAIAVVAAAAEENDYQNDYPKAIVRTVAEHIKVPFFAL